MITDRPAWSYRADPNVPAFEAGPCVSVMDAHCGLCAKGARWIARNDRRGEFAIVPMQSRLGSALMRHYGLDPADPTSWLYLEDGRAYSSLDAMIRAGRRLGGVWRALAILRFMPRHWQDGVYGFVARNRLRFAGRADLCALPDPAVKRRLMTCE